MLHLNYDIRNLRGAEYNPRHINDQDLTTLAESIKTLGLVKPLIVRGDLLVAGHQRTKALRHLGITHQAVYVLPCDTSLYDEVRFNQLHNGTDMDSGDEQCRLDGLAGLSGYTFVEPNKITGNLRSRMAYVRRAIAEMILKYGPWGGVVATESGEVIHCAQYALAAKMTNTRLTVYVIKDADKDKYSQYLNKQYGVFHYNNLEKTTYIQTYAQMMRLRAGSNKSKLYETVVIPEISKNKKLRGIDFGSGQGDYARFLRANGYNIHDVELFRRKGGGNTLDITSINRMIDQLCSDIKKHGQYDYVVCDSVINSVDSLEAESAVLTMIKGLCKPGGMIFFSGRCREFEECILTLKKAATQKTRLSFIDEYGFTANYRKGHWFYQKFHSKDDVKRLAVKHDLHLLAHNHDKSSFQVKAINNSNVELNAISVAIKYEFELKLSNGKPIGRSGDVLAAFNSVFKE